jgi:type II secretory pathway component GspD/PulD (secretin)
MNVLPKVSGGKITQNGFPEEETTEVQTTILMPDGGGVIIGGLIREDSVQARSIVPYIGHIPVLGRLFRRRADEMRRNELIVALVTHVMPEGCAPRCHEAMELDQTLPDYAARELLQTQVPLMDYP